MLFSKKRKNIPNNVSENIDAEALLEKHKNGLINDETFLISFSKAKIFYSTPFGDHKDGGSRLFALPDQENTAYLPVFASTERTMDFYEKAGRCGFVIMEGSFKSFLETASKINKGDAPLKMGAVIEPESYGVTISANMLDAVIAMLK